MNANQVKMRPKRNLSGFQSEIFPRCIFFCLLLRLMSATTTQVAPWSVILLLVSRKFQEYIQMALLAYIIYIDIMFFKL